MSNQFIIWGPPGCGKTTYLTRQIRRAAEAHGADRVMACSFTKAAATELATKEVDGAKADIPKSMVGTLHSLCYRALDRPPLAETLTAEFNERHPEYQLTGIGKPDVDDLGANDSTPNGSASDALFGQYQLLRARGVGYGTWPLTVQGFATAWNAWKESIGAYDFQDLIEFGPEAAPGSPRVLFCDEAQDNNALQTRLLAKWARNVESLVYCADDDQCVYSFAGADPVNLLDAGIPDENKRVLQQSYRIPRAVHKYATNWIERVERREPKAYQPRDADGAVIGSTATLRDIAPELDRIRDLAGNGETVMILATCGYMLRGWIAGLRDAGIAYHNPYRPSRGDWSPLRLGEGGAAARVSSFLAHEHGRPNWTMYNLGQWVPLLKAEGTLQRGAKADIEREAEAHPGYRPTLEEVAHRWLAPEARQTLLEGAWPGVEGLDWLVEHASPGKRPGVAYAASIAGRAIAQGREPRKVLGDGPMVMVGTAHSVKGGEARHVYVAPDLSPQAAEQWHRGSQGRDEVRRVFYVAFTRARETLTLLRPMGRLSVEF